MTLPTVQPGDRIRLLHMPNDPDPIPVGTEGTVREVNDLTSVDMGWQIHVNWDIDRSLSLVPEDTYEVIT